MRGEALNYTRPRRFSYNDGNFAHFLEYGYDGKCVKFDNSTSAAANLSEFDLAGPVARDLDRLHFSKCLEATTADVLNIKFGLYDYSGLKPVIDEYLRFYRMPSDLRPTRAYSTCAGSMMDTHAHVDVAIVFTRCKGHVHLQVKTRLPGGNRKNYTAKHGDFAYNGFFGFLEEPASEKELQTDGWTNGKHIWVVANPIEVAPDGSFRFAPGYDGEEPLDEIIASLPKGGILIYDSYVRKHGVRLEIPNK